ncbi:MAG: glutamine--fructose-6-phosphate transaminase (isomerizing) [Christensenellaceae bacterium]|jgi:glucosamine--fructose-6-phosphate aminotransferase (isomerizing)|nr:glutamine--fructose-6-phosphate transaminase (isomerizing) [Christensenellaceae bacterium]
MCGIVGYIGDKQAAPLLLEALKKLEYRGYDSSGIALVHEGALKVAKAQGRLQVLCERTGDGGSMPGRIGIGHTRWATHGEPNDTNSHPHLSQSGRVALVHNGIIENYMELREFLTKRGYSFATDTDTEIAVQLMDYCYHGDPVHAVREAVNMLTGSFALGILFQDFPDQLLAVRKDSPLVIGLGEGENFIASDIPALLAHTRDILRLSEYELAVIRKDGVAVFDRYGTQQAKQPEHVDWDAGAAEKGGYAHFMLKEIMEQPAVIRDTVRPRIKEGRIELGLLHITPEDIKNADRIYIVACGSAAHVGHIARLYIERMTRLPVCVELASEFRYCNPLVTSRTLTIAISQSGETLDTLFALREAKARGSKTISIVNVVGSTIAAASEDVIYTWAGLEIAVATTKAYSAQLAVCYLLSLYMGQCRGIVSAAETAEALEQIQALPAQIERQLAESQSIQYLASLYFGCKDIFFIGRNLDYAMALEGSLKLKEISYIHSEAYAAGELKHGTISLIEPGTLVVALCTYAPLRDKMISNIREVKARGATVLAITEEGMEQVQETADHVMWLPKAPELVTPSLAIIPLQLFAYYVALLKGCDIDKPRNLAKSVTVE